MTRSSLLLFVSFCLLSSTASAEEQATSTTIQSAETEQEPLLENCTRYKAKRADVPVYEEPEKSSRVVAKLLLGEEVCYVGEQNDFAIIDWRIQPQISPERKSKTKSSELVFIALSDLWAPADKGVDLEQSVRNIFESMGYGGQPDDIFGPVRAWLYRFTGGPECLAGAICEKVGQDLKEREE